MNTHDKYELPPLFLPGAIGKYTKKEMQAYARAAIEHFLNQSGQYLTNDASRQAAIDDAIEADRKQRWLKERAQLDQEWSTLKHMQAQYEADRQRRGEPVAYIRTISFENGEVQRDLVWASAAGDLSRYMDFVSFEPLCLPIAPQPAEPDYKALYFKEQALRMEAEACADMLRGDEPVKVPSNEEIIDTIVSYGKACAGLSTATERQMRLHEIRALLARYGQPASGHSAAPMDTSPGHSGQTAASAEPVGEAQPFQPSVTSGAFTHCIFESKLVPAGTKLYRSPYPDTSDGKRHPEIQAAFKAGYEAGQDTLLHNQRIEAGG